MVFQLRLSETPDAAAGYRRLGFSSNTRAMNLVGQYNPVYACAVGNSVELGYLFAYLFRRFGYPNVAWHPERQFVRYLFETPLDDMLMEVVPHVGRRSEEVFRFLVPAEKLPAIDAYQDLVDETGQGLRRLEPVRWAAGDPLRSYALAAQECLAALCVAVPVPGGHIDVFGLVDENGAVADVAAASGHACGYLGNLAPLEVDALQELVLKLGQGNPVLGARAAISCLARYARA